ncbi:MAG: molybdopterin-guanine dinucleotide biosynthesis protein B [Thermodesulfobacteriota bacterium]|nr:molybdopterin-guanine dinucleotide biosynthesis protein B [Thermodesulfobacteriota bacterium]
MKIVHIVGRSGNGKTTLIIELIEALTKRGLRVGTLKHSSHVHELDKSGKDSYRHRVAGGNPAAIATTDQIAVFLPRAPGENPFDRLSSLFGPCDVILVEGYIEGPGTKIEVWRAATEKTPIAAEQDHILAIVTDDPVETRLPVWPRKDVAALADKIQNL